MCGGEGEAGQGRGQEGQPRHGGVMGVWRLAEAGNILSWCTLGLLTSDLM